MAKKYENFPELLTPRTITKNMQTQARSSHNANFQSGKPIPSEIFSFSLITSFLKIKILKIISFNKIKKTHVKYNSELLILKLVPSFMITGFLSDEFTHCSSQESLQYDQGS